MSLLQTIASLVQSRGGDPVAASRDAWPEYTVPRGSDVTVAGVSLLALAAEVGTPCVRNAAAVIPGSGGRPSTHRFASVVVVRVISAVPETPAEQAQVWVDAELEACHPIGGAARLIGRSPGRQLLPTRIRPDRASALGPTVELLPTDVREGDLLAIPCAGATSLHEIRRHARHPERLSHDRLERPWDEFPAR